MKATKSILAWARIVRLSSRRSLPPLWVKRLDDYFIERSSRYWAAAKAGEKSNTLFEQGTLKAWQWANSARFIRWFTDGERRHGKALWQLASVYLKAQEVHPA